MLRILMTYEYRVYGVNLVGFSQQSRDQEALHAFEVGLSMRWLVLVEFIVIRLKVIKDRKYDTMVFNDSLDHVSHVM